MLKQSVRCEESGALIQDVLLPTLIWSGDEPKKSRHIRLADTAIQSTPTPFGPTFRQACLDGTLPILLAGAMTFEVSDVRTD